MKKCLELFNQIQGKAKKDFSGCATQEILLTKESYSYLCCSIESIVESENFSKHDAHGKKK